jgi:hypothetical protein
VTRFRVPVASRALAVLVLLAVAPHGATADAGSDQAPRQTSEAPGSRPAKDCTRINSRFGYYANPWCTPAEQLQWDRWEAKRYRAGR